MLLGKSCETEFHIKHGTIKLGTLYEYRTTEKEELQDQGEGMLNFHLNFHGRVRIPTIWYNTIAAGSVAFGSGKRIPLPGKVKGDVRSCKTGVVNADSVEITESTANFFREDFNSFIFCMSKVRRTSDCHGIFKGHNDYWYIRETMIPSLAADIGVLLLAHIRKQHSEGNYILPPETDMERLDIGISYREVNYVSREIHLYDKNGFIELEEFVTKVKDMAFIKPDSYAHELEYRFKYTPIVDNKVIEPIVNYTILDASHLHSYVFWL